MPRDISTELAVYRPTIQRWIDDAISPSATYTTPSTSSGGGGVTIHNDLTGRSASNTHPISAINGLQSELDDLAADIGAIDDHPAVTSPLGTIAGNFTTQALEVNEGHAFNWTANHEWFGTGHKVEISSGHLTFTGVTGGGWAEGISFETNGGTPLGGFGAYGYEETFNWFYIGAAHNSYGIKVDPANAVTMPNAVNMGSTLDVTGVLTADGYIYVNDISTTVGNLTISAAGDVFVNDTFRSTGFVAGTSGTRLIMSTGTAEFGSATIRGAASVGSNLTVTVDASVGGELDVNTITATGDIALNPSGSVLMGTAGDVQKYFDYSGSGTFGGPGAYIDWANGLADFRTLNTDNLNVKLLTVQDTEVMVGALMVARSGSRLTRYLTVPAVGATGTIYIKNIPGAVDESGNGMKAFRVGNDFISTYATFSGGSHYAAKVEETAHGYGEVQAGTGGTNPVSQDFQGVTVPALPSGWTGTDSNNSLSTDNTLWITASVDGTQALRTNASTGEDINFHYHYSGAGGSTRADYEYTGRSYGASSYSGRGMTMLSKYPSTSDTYVRVRRYSTNNYHVNCHGYAAPDGGVVTSSFSDTANVWTYWRMRVEDDGVSRTTLKARFWHDGDSEGTAWDIDCYWDGASRPQTGTWGLWAYQTAASPVYYDDLHVSDIGVTQIDATATVSMNHGDNITSMIAIVSCDLSSAIDTVPSGFTRAQYDLVDDHYVQVYTRPGAPATTGVVDYTWTESPSAAGSFVAVTMVAISGTSGATLIVSGGTEQSGSVWADNNVPYLSNVFELSIAVGVHDSPLMSVYGAYAIENYERAGVYSHKISGREFENKTASVNYSLDRASAGTTFRFAQTSASDTSGLRAGFLYGKFVSQSTPGDLETGEQAWLVEITRGPTGTVSLAPETSIVDVGLPGDSFWIANAIDSIAGGAYDQIVQRGDDPWDWTTKLRSGYLGGTQAYGSLGFYYQELDWSVEFSDDAARLQNVAIELLNSAAERTVSITQNEGISIALGAASVGLPAGFTFIDRDSLPAEQSYEVGGVYADVYSQSRRTVSLRSLASSSLVDSAVIVSAEAAGAKDAFAEIIAGTRTPAGQWASVFMDLDTSVSVDLVAEASALAGDSSSAELIASQSNRANFAGVRAAVGAAGVPLLSLYGPVLADDVITYDTGVEPSADQDLARMVDIPDPGIAPYINVFSDGGRNMDATGPTESVTASPAFATTYYSPYNGATMTDGGLFIHNNNNYGGSSGTMTQDMEDLIDATGRTGDAARYGIPFRIATYTAGSGTAGSLNGAYLLDSWALLLGASSKSTLSFWIRCKSGGGGAFIRANHSSVAFMSVDGTPHTTSYYDLPVGATSAAWHHIAISYDAIIGYVSSAKMLYANSGDVIQVAMLINYPGYIRQDSVPVHTSPLSSI